MDVTNNLSYYLDQIYTFLISNNKKKVFPSLTMAMEDNLVNIAKDANYLKSSSLDDDCKSLAAQITAALEKNRQVFTLSYAFVIDENGKKVMVYKKTPVPEFLQPLGLKQLRKPHLPNLTHAVSNTKDNSNSNLIMSSFKAKSLNATLKFVKNDAQLVLQYPDMSSEQAEFIKHMVTQCLAAKDDTDTGPGCQGMFDPLAKALRIFSLKYQFKLNSAVPTHYDMKRLFFEKIPKQSKNKEIDLDTISISSDNSDSSTNGSINTSLENINPTFVKECFLRIKEFLLNKTEDRLELPNLSVSEQRFVVSWKKILDTKTTFDEELDQAMNDISDILHGPEQMRVRTTIQKTSPTQRTVYLKKKQCSTRNLNTLLQAKQIPVKTTRKEQRDNVEVNNTLLYSLPIAKVTSENTTEVNKNTLLNSLPIAKVKSENTTEVNKNTLLNSLPIAKVKSENTTEVNKNVISNKNMGMPLKLITIANVKENTIEVNKMNTPLADMHKQNTEVNKNTPASTENTIELDNDDDFIAIRPDLSSISAKQKKKTSQLMRLMAELSGIFAKNAVIELRDFILHNNRDEIVFTKLKAEELQFLSLWTYVSSRVEVIRLFSIQGQMILDEIKTAVERSSGVFKVVVSSKTVSPLNRSITFTKVYRKKNNTDMSSTSMDEAASANTASEDTFVSVSNSSFSVSSSKHSKSTAAIEKKIDRFFNKTKHISDNWIRSTLTKLTDFIKDDAQASLIIPNITNPQMTFLTKWRKILKQANMIETYLLDIQMLMTEINREMSQNESKFTVSFKMTSVAKNQTRDITFFKKPIFSALDKTKSGMSKDGSNLAGNVPAKSAPKNNLDKAEITSANINPATSRSQGIPKASSATSLPVQKASAKARPNSANINSKQHKAKEKLIEALSQPLVSEKGLKMMRNMGWEGGALGARGEGIVEPIMLPLDLAKRAGLGSIKLPAKQAIIPITTNLPVNITRVMLPHSPCKTELKTGVLQTVMKIIKNAQPATEINFPNKLTLKNWSFVRHIVNTFNSRSKISLDPPSLTELCCKILDVMAQTEYIITACWGVSKKNILFILSKGIYQPSDLDSKDWCSIVNIDSKKSETLTVSKSVDIMVEGEAFRYYILAQILEFCERSNVTIDKCPSKSTLTKEVLLKGTMVPKQLAYIKDVLVRLNNKTRPNSDSDNEIALFNEIKAKIQGFVLDVDFPLPKSVDKDNAVHKCIRLHKVFQTQNTSPDKTITAPTVKIDDKSMKSINNQDKQKIKVSDRNIPKTTRHYENEKTVESNSWRRITVINDKVISNSMTDSQNAPIDSQDAPMVGQDAPMDGQDAPMVGQDAPMVGQDAPMLGQDAPMVSQRAPTDKMAEECICCYNVDLNDVNYDNTKQNVEYIFIESETYEIESLCRTITENKDIENVDATKITDKLDSELLNIANLNINEIKSPASVRHLESTEEMLNEFSEQNTEQSGFKGTYPNQIEKTDYKNQDTKNNLNKTIIDKDIGKRMRSNAVTPERSYKKCKYGEFIKKIVITPKNYPQTEITHKMAGEIQKSILDSIDYTTELPLLKCHGIQDGALIYSCHTEKSFNFIDNVIRSLDLKVSIMQDKYEKRYKMTVKINSYIDENIDTVFDRLGMYNMSLNTKDWKVFKMERSSDITVIYTEMDECSYNLIVKENFSLYAGTDEAKFSIVWE